MAWEKTALEGLLVLLIIGHIAINFTAELPRFLVAENIVKTVLYIIGLYAVHRGLPWGYYYVAIVAAFGAGRVSRTVVDPYGRLGAAGPDCKPNPAMAYAHIPLVLVELLAAILAALAGLRAAR